MILLARMMGDVGSTASLLEQDPRAYKDIDLVMESQKDLVKVEHVLHQILNYKGV